MAGEGQILETIEQDTSVISGPIFVYDHTETNPRQTYNGLPNPQAIWDALESRRKLHGEKHRAVVLAAFAIATRRYQETGAVAIDEAVREAVVSGDV